MHLATLLAQVSCGSVAAAPRAEFQDTASDKTLTSTCVLGRGPQVACQTCSGNLAETLRLLRPDCPEYVQISNMFGKLTGYASEHVQAMAKVSF